MLPRIYEFFIVLYRALITPSRLNLAVSRDAEQSTVERRLELSGRAGFS
jgi:hypothetical protein